MKIFLVHKDGKFLKHIAPRKSQVTWVSMGEADMFHSYVDANSAGLFAHLYESGSEELYEIREYDLSSLPFTRRPGQAIDKIRK